MEIRHLYDAVVKFKELDRNQRSKVMLSENEKLQMTELKSYIDFWLGQHLQQPNSVTISKRSGGADREYLVKVRYEDLSEFYEGFMITKARGGIYLKTNNLLLVGTQLDLYIHIASQNLSLHFPGKVVWSAPKTMGNIPPGMGIKFSNLQDSERELLDQFVEGLCEVEKLRTIASRGEA